MEFYDVSSAIKVLLRSFKKLLFPNSFCFQKHTLSKDKKYVLLVLFFVSM